MQILTNIWLQIGLILGLVIVLGYLRIQQVKAFNRQRRRAAKATAKLLRIDQSISSERTGMILVNIALEIDPPGGAPYSLHNIKWYIEPAAASKFQEGLVMNVRIDKDDRKIIFPAERWARIA